LKILTLFHLFLKLLIGTLIASILAIILILSDFSLVSNILKEPLKTAGLEYKNLSGNILGKVELQEVDFNKSVKFKMLSLDIDVASALSRHLIIKDIKVENIEIKEKFIKDILDKNETNETTAKPFDRIDIYNANISMKSTKYQDYEIKKASLNLKKFTTDLNLSHRGDIKLQLNANFADVNTTAFLNKQSYKSDGNIDIHKDFIAKYLDKKSHIVKSPNVKFSVDGDEKFVKFIVDGKNIEAYYDNHSFISELLRFSGGFDIKRFYLDSVLNTSFDSNVASAKLLLKSKVALKDINNSLVLDLNSTLRPKKEFANLFIEKYDTTLTKVPLIELKAKGDFKNLKVQTLLKDMNILYQKNAFLVNNLKFNGDISLLKGDNKIDLATNFGGNIAKGSLNLKSSFNLKDINNTLNFTTDAKITPNGSFSNLFIKKYDAKLLKMPFIDIKADGTLKKIRFLASLDSLKATYQKRHIGVDKFKINGDISALHGDSDIHLSSLFSTDEASGDIGFDGKFNYLFPKAPIKFVANSSIDGNAKVLSEMSKLNIINAPHIEIKAYGSQHLVTTNIDAIAKINSNNITSDIKLQSSPILFDVANKNIKGEVTYQSGAKELNLNGKLAFSGDVSKPKEMSFSGFSNLNKFIAFGYDLSSLTPMRVDVDGLKALKVALKSKNINALVQSPNLDKFKFQLKTQNIYPTLIDKNLIELDGKFINFDGSGEISLSNQNFNINGNLGSNDNFLVQLEGANSKNGLHATLKNSSFEANVDGNLKTQNLKANLKIGSIKSMLKEINKLYATDEFEVDGAVDMSFVKNGDKFEVLLHSPKVAMEEFNIEKISVKANGDAKTVYLKEFSFRTSEFANSSLNQNFYLKKEGKISLGDRMDMDIEMSPNISIKSNGTKSNYQGNIKMSKFLFGMPNIGEMVIDTDIKYAQNGDFSDIKGDVNLSKMKLTYEAKFLEVDKDDDVIVITKKDKLKNAQTVVKKDSMDININAMDAIYKTPNIDTKMDIAMKLKKSYPQDKDMRIFGKIENIEGLFIQGTKKFYIKPSSVVFRGDKDINPILDIDVDYKLPQVLINIAIKGDKNHPQMSFASEPFLPQKDILSYLMFGISSASLGKGEGSMSREATLFMANEMARDLAGEFGLDLILIKDDGNGVTTSTLDGTDIEFMKKISDKNSVIIEKSYDGNAYTLQRELSDNIKAKASMNEKSNPSQSVELEYRKKFR